jgi:two-component system osmolarity sensor histidine kinase EnvZ
VKRHAWLPDTLFGRNVLLIAGLIIVVQIIVTIAFIATVSQRQLNGITRYAIQHTESMRRALEAMDQAEVDRYIATVNAAGPTQVVRGGAPAEANETEPSEPFLRVLNRALTAQMPRDYETRWQAEPERRLWLGADVRGEKVWFGLGVGALMTDTATVVFGIVLVAGLIAFVGAYAIQRRLNQPLRRLMDAAAQIGAGRAPRPVPEQGAQEVAALARSFNAMVDSLARADRDRALMLAGISHDLRTPLTKLQFALEYVGPHCEPDMRALMERNIEAADRIIDQFIDFARYGNDETAQAADLNALATSVVRSFDPQPDAIDLELATLPSLHLRPIAIQRLIANLLRNAVEYAGKGIVVRTTNGTDAYALSVLDRGPGIPAAQIERLKQPFTRLEAARSGKGGSGLGLAIVERITQLHGGRFELLARDGGGLEAKVSLPLSVRAA